MIRVRRCVSQQLELGGTSPRCHDRSPFRPRIKYVTSNPAEFVCVSSVFVIMTLYGRGVPFAGPIDDFPNALAA